MDRRKFFKIGTTAALGTTLLRPLEGFANTSVSGDDALGEAKNIIILVSDGMSQGTLSLTDIFINRQQGVSSNWLNLYKEQKVTRAMMDMASANAIVTDSAAASSSWGSGYRVNNGSINIGVNKEKYTPIWLKFKKAGKKAGCVTTVAITHATPAGFMANSDKRNAQDDIAEQYLEHEYDVLFGGGDKFFSAEYRKDKKDLYKAFKTKGYQIVKDTTSLERLSKTKALGIFANDALPYNIDLLTDSDARAKIPTLAQMTQKAIELLNTSSNGFVLQVESGKVDWAAHANDLGALIYEQIAIDQAVKVAVDFAIKDKNTLVILTTDHGNANPGLIYGKKTNENFDAVRHYIHSNEWILNQFSENSTIEQIISTIKKANGFEITQEQAQRLLSYYQNIERSEDGLYNYKKLPYKSFSLIQQEYNSVGWIGMDHSSDYVELAMFGPGSQNLKPFIKNTDLHYFMLEVCGVKSL
ncbi:MAG: alkaline phosphatase [Bacteroidota bacterium]|nr:alkaline phosphatase [Bacteroidota bacterium]